MAILGPNIARDTALRVAGLTINGTGEVTQIDGDPLLVMQDLVNGLMTLSAPITQMVLYGLLEAYPDIKGDYNQPLEKIKLVCSLTEKKEGNL